MKVFLGGTCNGSKWREDLIPLLEIDYFNPVVEDWTPDCQEEEIRQREECDYCLYVVTPKMTGFFSIAEVADDSNKRPGKTVFLVLEEDEGVQWQPHQMKSLNAVKKLVFSNGGKVFTSLKETANQLNSFAI